MQRSSLDLLAMPSETRFDRYMQLMSEIFNVPMAAVCLTDGERQWFKSSVGLDGCETLIGDSFCAHALRLDVLEVSDAREDDMFRDHPAVVGELCLRFFMGSALRGPNGQAIGTLCIMDTQPRCSTRVERTWLVAFGHLVEELINHDNALAAVLEHDRPDPERNNHPGIADDAQFENAITNLLRLSESGGDYLAVLHMRLNRIEDIYRATGTAARDAVLHCLIERLAGPDNKVLAVDHQSIAWFGAVIPLHSVRELFEIISPIVNRLSRPISVEGRAIHPEIEVGISLSPLDGMTPEDLLRRAAAAASRPVSHKRMNVSSNDDDQNAGSVSHSRNN